MKSIKNLIIAILIILSGGSGGYFATSQLGSFGHENELATSITQATTSISIGARSVYYIEPTSTDPSVTSYGYMPWVLSTTTYAGTPDKIPNEMANKGFEYCIDGGHTGEDIRFWFSNSTGTDKKMASGMNSSGILLSPGNCWDSRKYGIVWGGNVYSIASTTTSTVQYTIYK